MQEPGALAYPVDGVRPVERCGVPRAALAWIDVKGSMTARIESVTGRTPEVRLVATGTSDASVWEAQVLDQERGHCRHIELRSGDEVCLVARSLAPEGTDTARMLRDLGTRPLADVLFQDRWLQSEIRPVIAADGRFGRACVWTRDGHAPLLLTEVFEQRFVERFAP